MVRRLPVLIVMTLAGALMANDVPAAPASPVNVWVELSEPPSAQASAPEARRRLARQQDEIAGALAELGAHELARVRHARNAIAVRIAPDRLDAVRALPGVRQVSPVEALRRREPMHGASSPRTQPR